MEAISRWFAPPEMSRLDVRSRARALWLVSWPFFAVVTVVLGIAVLVEPHTLARRATTVAAVGLLISLLHSISRAGRPTLASWMLVLGLSVIVTQRAWITGGIHAPVAVFYVLFIVMAGVLIGARGAFVTAALCFLGAILLTVGTALEWLTPRPGAGSPLAGLVFVVLAIGLALVIQALVTYRPRRERMGDKVLQMYVHDMRAPMQVLLANLEELRENRGGNARDLEEAIGGVVTMRRMTTSLLDVSKLEAGRLSVQRSVTDLSALARSVVTSIRVLQPDREITIQAHGDPACSCDPELTRRIIENLVSNAMKHTQRDGRVQVVIVGSVSGVSLGVIDEGEGVPEAQRARIFEPFGAEGLVSITGYESSGLGLAFCRLAAEAQGGTIRVEDAKPRGSAFIVELPRN